MLTVAAGCQEERTAVDKELLAAKEIVRERTDLKKRLGDQVRLNLQIASSRKNHLAVQSQWLNHNRLHLSACPNQPFWR